jgi:hypothetical protein
VLAAAAGMGLCRAAALAQTVRCTAAVMLLVALQCWQVLQLLLLLLSLQLQSSTGSRSNDSRGVSRYWEEGLHMIAQPCCSFCELLWCGTHRAVEIA